MTTPGTMNLEPQTEDSERSLSPQEAVETSNRDVITAIYAAAQESLPDTLVQETNGSRSYIDYAGLIRLVWDGERKEAEGNPYGYPVNPVIDKLSELVASGRVSHDMVPDTHNKGFRPVADRLYELIDKAWGPVYSFTDISSGAVICYSVKTNAHPGAETVLVSADHVAPR